VFSVRSLLFVWVSSTVATIGYAYADLTLTPGLQQERGFSIHIDVERVGELWHWGGRLLNEGAVGLLVFNAITLGGMIALLMLWIGQLVQKVIEARYFRREPPVSTTVAFGSIPPPAS
jgi:hypothetical protein